MSNLPPVHEALTNPPESLTSNTPGSLTAHARSLPHGKEGLDVFDAPEYLSSVELEVEDVTAKCPITRQQDFYTVTIQYEPRNTCVETKSLKLYLAHFEDVGIFCEKLAHTICDDVGRTLHARYIKVTCEQSIRGGIRTTATAVGAFR